MPVFMDYDDVGYTPEAHSKILGMYNVTAWLTGQRSPVYPSDVIFLQHSSAFKHVTGKIVAHHVVNPTEQSIASVPFAHDFRIVLRFMPCAVFVTGEPALDRLRTAFVPTKERFRVPLVVLS